MATDTTDFQTAAERYTKARIALLKARDDQSALHDRLYMAEIEKGWQDEYYLVMDLDMAIRLMPAMVETMSVVQACVIELIEAEGALIAFDKNTVQIRA